MYGKLVAIAGLAIAVSVLGATAARGAPRTTTATKSVTFHLVEKDVGFNFIDNPPRQGFRAAPLIGDGFAFTSELRTKSGAHAGWLEATCTVARGGTRSEGPCYGVFALKGGQLMAMAQFKFYGNAPTHVVIVGGTGVYRGATGSVLSVSRGENSEYSDDTFTLSWAT
jgi:hypothetical protein